MTVKISGNSSASTPSFAGDDGDSGLHATADQVQLVTNGTVGVTVDSSQQVGIATDNPGTRLDVISTASASTPISRFKSGTAAGDRGVEIASDANSNVFLQAIRGSDNTSNFQLCLNPNGGNVGVGETSPNGRLHVSDSGNAILRIQSTNDGQAILNFNGSSQSTLGQILYNVSSNYMRFYVNSAERMRIASNGFIFPDASSTQYSSSYKSTAVGGFRWIASSSTTSVRAESYGATTNTRYHQSFSNPNGVVGSISTVNSATSFNTSSDYRLKENVVNIDDGIDRVKQLQPRRFNFIVDTGLTVDGFIAHEVQNIVPEAVTGEKDAVRVWEEDEDLPAGVSVGDNKLDDDGNTIPEYQGIDQSKLVPLLTAALQEAIAKIETLETVNAEQATTIASFEARISALEGGN